MAYGRLDVYWPDGPIESYQLEKPSIAIGRSSGNDIVLDTTAVSRYHVTLTRQDQQVVLEDLDSVNGTYIDGERIRAHDPISLTGGEEIQIGDIRVIFHALEDVDENPTRPVSVPENQQETRRIELEQPTFRVELDPPADPVTPGAYIQANLLVTNVGRQVDQYSVEIEGVPKDWVRMDRAQFEIDPGGDVPVLISFKPLRRSESAPGDYPVTIHVKAQSVPEQPIEARMHLMVRAYSGFGIVLGTERITPDDPFELHVHNQGSGPLALTLAGAAPGGGLVFDLGSPSLTLAPGERRAIHGYVRPAQRQIIGAPRERRFDLLARAQDASGFLAAVQGTLVEKPVLPLWVPTLIIPVVLAALIFVVVAAFTIFNHPRVPVISAISTSATRVFVGDVVTLSWTVSDADQVTVSVDNGAPIPVNPPQSSYKQVMTDSGDHVLTVQAANGANAVQQTVTITVSKPLKINAFSVSPNPLLRNVWQNVTITWNVDGAQSVQFQGIEALTGKADPQAYSPVGQLQLQGTPRDTVALKLVALGTDNNTAEQSVRVEVANPVCKVNVDKAEIRGGPGNNYPVSGTIAKDAEVSPDGRDQTSQWVHLVPSANPQAWLSASALTCNGYTPDALTVIAALPPTPAAPTIAPTTPPTSVPTSVPATASPAPTLPTIIVVTVTPDSGQPPQVAPTATSGTVLMSSQ